MHNFKKHTYNLKYLPNRQRISVNQSSNNFKNWPLNTSSAKKMLVNLRRHEEPLEY